MAVSKLVAAALALSAAATLLAVSDAAAGDIIRLRADDWCPYNCEPGSTLPGYLIELADAALVPAGFTVDYKLQPWNRALDGVSRGRIDGAVGAYAGDAPDALVQRLPLGLSVNVAVVQGGRDWRYQSPASLAGKTIGLIKHYTYGEAIDGFARAHPRQIDLASGDYALRANLRKLIAGRIDLLIEDRNVLGYNLEDLQLADKVAIAGTVSAGDAVYIALNRKMPRAAEVNERLADTLVAMRADGRLGGLLAKYAVRDWAEVPGP